MSSPNDFTLCFKAMEKASRISVLTGAGVSTLSGIQDFRGENGFYNQKGPLYGVSREQLFDIDFFRARPEIFYCYARDYLYSMLDKTPSIAHTVLARMQKAGAHRHGLHPEYRLPPHQGPWRKSGGAPRHTPGTRVHRLRTNLRNNEGQGMRRGRESPPVSRMFRPRQAQGGVLRGAIGRQ